MRNGNRLYYAECACIASDSNTSNEVQGLGEGEEHWEVCVGARGGGEGGRQNEWGGCEVYMYATLQGNPVLCEG